MTDAHQRMITLRWIECWPAHEPRANDPNYVLFHRAKERLRKAGLLKCVVESQVHEGPVELHHSKVEFAHINDVSLEKFNNAYGLNLTDEEFARYVEEEGNLEPLCTLHHRGVYGIHSLSGPTWEALRTSKDDHSIVLPLRLQEAA